VAGRWLVDPGVHRCRPQPRGRENTLIFYIWGDNGSSAEGQNGTISELLAQNGIPTTVDMHIRALDDLGGLDVLGTPKVEAGWRSSAIWSPAG
jgi:arylsulfatase